MAESKMLAHYHIEEEHNSNSIVRIYRAFDTQQSQSVYIKRVLDPNDESYKYFRREYQIFFSIKHENLIEALNVVNNNCFIFELVQGISLKDLLQRNNNLTLADKVAIAHKLCTIVAIFYRAGLYRFNIKPHDVVILKGYGLKFTGLGVGKNFETLSSEVTVADEVIDEIAYTSPEQLRGKMLPQSVIFSLGSLLYQLFSNGKESPFYALNLHNCYDKILTYSPPPLAAIFPTKDPREQAAYKLLSDIVEKALDKDIDKRWQNTEEIAQQLSNIYQLLLPIFNNQSNFTLAPPIDDFLEQQLEEISQSFPLEEQNSTEETKKSPSTKKALPTNINRRKRIQEIKENKNPYILPVMVLCLVIIFFAVIWANIPK